MKKICLLLSLCLVFGITGCAVPAGESSVPESSETEDTTVVEETSEGPDYLDGKKLVVFGDSITALGTWGKSAAEDLNMYFYNGALGGSTTVQGLERFDAFVTAHQPDYVTILFGMNDLIMTDVDTPRVTPEQFKENLMTMVQKTRDCGAEPILLTSNPLDPDRFYSAQGQDPSDYANVTGPLEWLEVYNDVTRAVAEETGCYLIDMYKACEGVSYSALLKDGIHLSGKGNEIFRETLVSWFREHFENDPDAEKVDVRDTYTVLGENQTASIISFNKEDWYCQESGTVFILAKENILRMSNTNGLWPTADYELVSPVEVSVADGYLRYNLSTADVGASIILFFDGDTPTAYTESKTVKLQAAIGATCNSVGDMVSYQNLSGVIPLSELGIPNSVIHDGKVLISGIKVYIAGNANQNVTFRELSVTTEPQDTQ